LWKYALPVRLLKHEIEAISNTAIGGKHMVEIPGCNTVKEAYGENFSHKMGRSWCNQEVVESTEFIRLVIVVLIPTVGFTSSPVDCVVIESGRGFGCNQTICE
jgi:hypothetical protein